MGKKIINWGNLTGTTKLKRKISKATHIPTTKSGRKTKARRVMTGGGCLMSSVSIFIAVSTLIFTGCVINKKNKF